MKNKMFENVNRISIVGGPGAGKTTLADSLGKVLDLPVLHIDGINYFPNWVNRDVDERDKIILGTVKQDKWVIDGTYRSTLNERFENSDLIVFLDYSTIAKLKGVISRHIKHRGKEKKEIPGCKDRMSLWLIRLAFTWNIKNKKDVLELLNKNDDNKIKIFKNRKELNKWYEEQFGESINPNI